MSDITSEERYHHIIDELCWVMSQEYQLALWRVQRYPGEADTRIREGIIGLLAFISILVEELKGEQ